jgi:phosphoheptose isomerase
VIPETIEELVEKSLPRSKGFCSGIARGALVQQIAEASRNFCQAFGRGSRVLVVGMGTSALHATYLADELIGSAALSSRPLAAIGLTTNVVRRVQALAQPFDVVCMMGADRNDLESLRQVLRTAKSKSCFTIGLLSKESNVLNELLDTSMVVPGRKLQRIKERHGQILQVMISMAGGMR